MKDVSSITLELMEQSRGIFKGKALVLSNKYKWKLKRYRDGSLLLFPIGLEYNLSQESNECYSYNAVSLQLLRYTDKIYKGFYMHTLEAPVIFKYKNQTLLAFYENQGSEGVF